MIEVVKSVDLKDGNVLEISYDTTCMGPREDQCNLGIMAIFHKRYSFGDKDIPFNADMFEGWDEMQYYIESTLKSLVCLPIYMYDHGGQTINTTGYSCPFDSGQVGFIYVTNKQLDKIGTSLNDGEEWSDFLQRLKDNLIAEVNKMDTYICGEVYGFEIKDPEGNYVDGCSGFYGNDFRNNGILDHLESEPVNLDDL